MASTVPTPRPSVEVHSLDHVRPTPAKATVDRPSRSIAVGAVVKDALQRHHGSLKAASIAMNYDPSQLTRDLDSGYFRLERLDRCDDEAKAFVANALRDAFGDGDPKAFARRVLREVRQRLDELSEVL